MYRDSTPTATKRLAHIILSKSDFLLGLGHITFKNHGTKRSSNAQQIANAIFKTTNIIPDKHI
jgi:hypothetical protein